MNDSHIVTDDAISPAKPDGTCCYCSVPLGAVHALGCVMRKKKVAVRYIFDLEKKVPEHWDDHDILFHMNDSSWCANNAIDELQELIEINGCLCNDFTGEIVKETP